MRYEVKFDYLYYGIISGIIAGLTQNVFTRPLVWTHVVDRGILEQAQMILISTRQDSILASVVGLWGHLFNSGLWGGIFAILITKFPGHKCIKGAGVGMGAWIAVMLTVSFLGKHSKGPEEPLHALVLIISATLYGVILAWVYGRLTRKFS